MASWGNESGDQFTQPMDSNGQKLKVRNTSGTYSESDYQLDVRESVNGNAIKVDGNIRMVKTSGQSEVRTGTIESIVNQPSGTGELRINTQNDDPDVTIGWGPGNNGNTVLINADKVGIGGSVGTGYNTSIRGPVRVSGDESTNSALDVVGDVKASVRITTPEIDSNDSSGDLVIGSTNTTGQIQIGRLGVGNTIIMSGGVNVLDGTAQGASLSVQGHISGDTVGSSGELDVGGDLDVVGDAEIDGDLTVGSAQTPADATIHGDLTVGTAGQGNTATINGATQCNGPLTVGTTQLGTDTTLNGNAAVTGILTVGTSQVPTNATVNGKLTVTGTVGLNNKLGVTGEATFSAQTNHLNGIRINPLSDSTFTGFRYQNSRIEFVVAGTLRAYIDNTGVHNA